MNGRALCIILAGGSALLTAACSQHYNGAMGFGDARDEDREATQAAPARPETAADDTRPAPAQALAEAPPAAPSTPAAPVEPVASPVPAEPSAAARQSPRVNLTAGLSLFGQVDEQGPGTGAEPGDADNIRQVSFALEGADFDPAVDPEGTMLAYASTRHDLSSNLYLKRVDGTAVTQLTAGPSDDVMPAFSPDGQRIAFASNRSGNWDIYLADLDGGQPVQITDDASHDLHPTFSPEGDRLVYCSLGARSGEWEMVVVDLTNPGTRKFIGRGLFPSWSPDGDTILFQRARQRGTRWFSLWTVELVDGEASAPTEIAASGDAACITPDWSPDGRHVVFCTVDDPAADDPDRPTRADVWMVAADGTNRVRLTEGRFANLQPAWASDGTIFFVSDRAAEGRENIWSLSPARALQLAQPADRQGQQPAAMAPAQR